MRKTHEKQRFFGITDGYVRKARLAPALLTVLVLVPAGILFSLPALGWAVGLTTGAGLAAAVAIGLSQLSSAMGNRYQRKVYPRWPFDSPTNQRLCPFEGAASKQQKSRWYASVKSITGLDVLDCPVDDRTELDSLINDAITEIRAQLWKHPKADRLHCQNADYGFARNFAGLSPIWLSLSALNFLTCLLGIPLGIAGSIAWALASGVLLLGLALLARFVLRDYVMTKAEHYADSFFNALGLLEAESELGADQNSNQPQRVAE